MVRTQGQEEECGMNSPWPVDAASHVRKIQYLALCWLTAWRRYGDQILDAEVPETRGKLAAIWKHWEWR